MEEFIPFPRVADWQKIEEGFRTYWQLFISIFRPNNSGWEYFNYKGFYSIMLMALWMLNTKLHLLTSVARVD